MTSKNKINPDALPFVPMHNNSVTTKNSSENRQLPDQVTNTLQKPREEKLDATASEFLPASKTVKKQSDKPSNEDYITISTKALSSKASPFIPGTFSKPKQEQASTSTNLFAGAVSFHPPPLQYLGSSIPKQNNLSVGATPYVPRSTVQEKNTTSKNLSAHASTFHPSIQTSIPNAQCPNIFGSENIHSIKETQRMQKSVEVCKFFAKGFCSKGMECSFLHENQTILETVERRGPQKEALHHGQQPNNAVISFGDGLVCSFGPGLVIQKMDFSCKDSQTVIVSGLPPNATESFVRDRLSKYGNIVSLTLQDNAKASERYATVVFENPNMADRACGMLHGTKPSSWGGTPSHGHGMRQPYTTVVSVQTKGSSSSSSIQTVKVQWYTPVCCGWVHFNEKHSAKIAAQRCNGMTLRGRSILAKFQEPTHIASSRGHLSVYSVWLGNLDPSLSTSNIRYEIEKVSRFRVASVVMGKPPYDKAMGPKNVHSLLQKHGGPLTMFDISTSKGKRNNNNQKEKALAKFAFQEDATLACQYFQKNPKIPTLGGNQLFVQCIYTAKYLLPLRIAETLRASLGIALSDQDSIRFSIHPNKATEKAVISISADSAELLWQTKNDLNPLLSGTVLMSNKKENSNATTWKQQWLSTSFQNYLHSQLQRDADAVWFDTQRRIVRIFGAVGERPRISKMLLKALQDREETVAVSIANCHYESILQQGRAFLNKLRLACGGNKISLDLKSRSLLVEGSAEIVPRVQQQITNLLDKRESGSEDSCCPICFCPPDEENVTLSCCSHVYCRECFTSWLSGSNLCTFPLTCLSDGCNTPIPLKNLELENIGLSNLLRASLDNHIRNNPTKFQFCPVVTCDGIFRIVDDGNTNAKSPCSSCSQQICLTCRVGHDPLSCPEYKMLNLPLDQVRLKVIEEILTLRCPRCQQAFMDFDGCFAISCSVCPCNFCGWCLKDCGADAHPHVKMCPKKPKSADTYFGTRQQFETAQIQTRKENLMKFLKDFGSSQRQKIIDSLRTELNDLKISV